MGDGLYLQRRRQREGSPVNPQKQLARHTVAEELRSSLRRHEDRMTTDLRRTSDELEARLEATTQAAETRIAQAVSAVTARAEVLKRDFFGRLRWLFTGR